jgi:hypothetical protein
MVELLDEYIPFAGIRDQWRPNPISRYAKI